ncbi:MAG: hypothetical protein ABH834_02465 [Candidatus Altiarchaeota archaeon]
MMKEALFIGGLGGLLHGLAYGIGGDAGWPATVTLLTLLGLAGGALMSSFYQPRGGVCLRNLAASFLMGFIPNTFLLFVIGSDNNPVFFGFIAGSFTVLASIMYSMSR